MLEKDLVNLEPINRRVVELTTRLQSISRKLELVKIEQARALAEMDSASSPEEVEKIRTMGLQISSEKTKPLQRDLGRIYDSLYVTFLAGVLYLSERVNDPMQIRKEVKACGIIEEGMEYHATILTKHLQSILKEYQKGSKVIALFQQISGYTNAPAG